MRHEKSSPTIPLLISAAVLICFAFLSIFYFDSMLSDFWVISGVLFTIAFLFIIMAFRRNELVYDSKSQSIRHKILLGPYKWDKFNIPIQKVKAITIEPAKINVVWRTKYWVYTPVLVLSDGKIYEISDPIAFDLKPANERALDIAKKLDIPFIPGEYKCLLVIKTEKEAKNIKIEQTKPENWSLLSGPP